MRIGFLFLISAIYLLTGLEGHAETFKFRHYSTDDGLLNNEVRTMVMDKEGFLWIGTSSGLNRYDGHRIRSYVSDPDDIAAIPENEVEELLVDSQDGLWIKTRNSWCLYVREQDAFMKVSDWLEGKGINANDISRVYSDRNGMLWFISGQRLIRYDCHSEEFHDIILCHDSPVEAISDNGKELYCLHSREQVLCAFDMSARSWREVEIPSGFNLNRVFIDRDDRIWLYSTLNDSLLMSGGTGWKQVHLKSHIRSTSNFIRSVQDGEDGKLWIATDHKGLFSYDKTSGGQTNITAGGSRWDISENSIGCAYRDPKGVLWLGYVKNGLSCHHKSFSVFESHQSGRYENISCTMEDSKGNIWVGTDGYGVFCHDRSGDILLRLDIPGNIAVSIMEDSNGLIWIGTYLHGLICCKGDRISRHYTKENSGLSDNSIYTLQEDKNGNIWIGSLWGNLQCLDTESGTFTDYRADRDDKHTAISMYYDGGEDLYIGMLSGLWRMNVDTGEHTVLYGNASADAKFRYEAIQSVFVDSRGLMWLGHNQGLTVWNRADDQLYYLSHEDGLCDNLIRGISEDANGIIWVTTSNGCSAINVREGNDAGLIFSFDNYHMEDGLAGDSFSNHSVSPMSDGSMLLGTSTGYTIVDLDRLYSSDASGSDILFTGLQVSGKDIKAGEAFDGRVILDRSMECTDLIRLKHSDSFITIEYSSMKLLSPERARYAYKADWIGDEWIETRDNRLTFKSLPSGRHRLQVCEVSKDGTWDDDTAGISIVVSPPFYRSAVAFCIYFMLLTTVLLCGRRIHIARKSSAFSEVRKDEEADKQKAEINPSEPVIVSLDEQLLAKAIRIVEDNIDEADFSVDDLAAAVGFTRGHLYKKLMAITGKGPSEFIRTIRMKRARQLLEQSQLQISEIAYSVGYSSPKVFSRNFKTEFGVLPSEYQKIQKSN